MIEGDESLGKATGLFQGDLLVGRTFTQRYPPWDFTVTEGNAPGPPGIGSPPTCRKLVQKNSRGAYFISNIATGETATLLCMLNGAIRNFQTSRHESRAPESSPRNFLLTPEKPTSLIRIGLMHKVGGNVRHGRRRPLSGGEPHAGSFSGIPWKSCLTSSTRIRYGWETTPQP